MTVLEVRAESLKASFSSFPSLAVVLSDSAARSEFVCESLGKVGRKRSAAADLRPYVFTIYVFASAPRQQPEDSDQRRGQIWTGAK
jgi:hypothetical protein